MILWEICTRLAPFKGIQQQILINWIAQEGHQEDLSSVESQQPRAANLIRLCWSKNRQIDQLYKKLFSIYHSFLNLKQYHQVVDMYQPVMTAVVSVMKVLNHKLRYSRFSQPQAHQLTNMYQQLMVMVTSAMKILNQN